MAQTRLRVGVIGCGLVAQVMHLHYLRELNDLFHIAAVCDLSRTVVNAVGDAYGVSRRFVDWRALLEEPLDAVMVLTPGSHEPIAVAAAQAGRHVFIEKPVALSEAEGESIVAAGKNAGVRMMVGYMKRYDPAVERMAQVLKDLKELRFVRSTTSEYPLKWYVGHYPLARATDVDTRTLKELQADDDARVTKAIGTDDPVLCNAYRNFLLDSMIHDINLMRGLLGAPSDPRFATAAPSGVALFVDFPGTSAAMQWIYLKDGIARYQQEFAFFSPQGTARLIFPSPFLRSAPTELLIEGGSKDSPRSWRTAETMSFEEAFKQELLELHACITDNREPRTTVAEATQDVAFCQAIIRRCSSSS